MKKLFLVSCLALGGILLLSAQQQQQQQPTSSRTKKAPIPVHITYPPLDENGQPVRDLQTDKNTSTTPKQAEKKETVAPANDKKTSTTSQSGSPKQ